MLRAAKGAQPITYPNAMASVSWKIYSKQYKTPQKSSNFNVPSGLHKIILYIYSPTMDCVVVLLTNFVDKTIFMPMLHGKKNQHGPKKL